MNFCAQPGYPVVHKNNLTSHEFLDEEVNNTPKRLNKLIQDCYINSYYNQMITRVRLNENYLRIFIISMYNVKRYSLDELCTMANPVTVKFLRNVL